MREADRQNRLVSDLQSEVTEWRNQLRSQQRERERERMEHETKIRELQKVVAQEHCSKESLEMQVCFTKNHDQTQRYRNEIYSHLMASFNMRDSLLS